MGDQALSPNPPQFCAANLDQEAGPADKIKNKIIYDQLYKRVSYAIVF